MSINVNTAEITVGIVGAGAMGRGIAQVAATGGMNAVIYDAGEGVAEKAVQFIAGMLKRSVDKSRMTAVDANAAIALFSVARSMGDFAPCHVVVEAVVENIDVKREIFTALEKICGNEAILASNTSSLRIASIASACRRRGRIAGLHFFNPVPLMKLVEVVAAPDTDPGVIEALTALGRRMGRVPVVVKDAPGFLVNLGGSAYGTEALRIVSEGVATPAEVDAVMKDACGFRMGPFELLDLTGIDVNFPVRQVIYNGFFQDRRLATSPVHETMRESGRLGRKTGRGFYDYDADGNRIAVNADADTSAAPAARVLLAEPDERLAGLARQAGVEVVTADDGASPILCAPTGEDCTAVAARLNLDARRLVAVDLTGNIAKRLTVMTAPGADDAAVGAVASLLAATGAAVTRIKDSPGFVAQRILAMVANLGCEMAQIGTATPADIDTAMKLGLNYPQGPLELTDAMGPGIVHAILGHLQAITGDDRYRPSLWLRRRALLGLPAHTPN